MSPLSLSLSLTHLSHIYLGDKMPGTPVPPTPVRVLTPEELNKLLAQQQWILGNKTQEQQEKEEKEKARQAKLDALDPAIKQTIIFLKASGMYTGSFECFCLGPEKPELVGTETQLKLIDELNVMMKPSHRVVKKVGETINEYANEVLSMYGQKYKDKLGVPTDAMIAKFEELITMSEVEYATSRWLDG